MLDNRTDIMQSKIEGEIDIQVELIKQMKELTNKVDSIIRVQTPQ